MRWWNPGAKGWPQLESESRCLAHQHPKGKSAGEMEGREDERRKMEKREGGKEEEEKGDVITNVKDLLE